MHRFALLGVALLAPATAVAQVPEVLYTGGPQFLVAIVAGLILAVGFQLVLTNLSLATGVTALGPLDEGDGEGDQAGTGVHQSIRRLTSGIGVWTLISASVALFFASWLAVQLAVTPTLLAGAVLGLVIWALFFIAMSALELSALSSLVGFVTRTATTGLTSAYQAVTDVFRRSPPAQIGDAAAEVVRSARAELLQDKDLKGLTDQLGAILQRAERPALDPARIRSEIGRLLEDVEIRAYLVDDPTALTDRSRLVARLRQRGMDEESVKHVRQGLSEAVQTLREEARSDKDDPTKAVDAALRVGGLSREEAEAQRTRFERYLRETGRPELNPEGIKRDLEAMFREEGGDGGRGFQQRLDHFDRETAVALLAQRSDMDHTEAERVVDQISSTLHDLGAAASEASDKATELGERALRRFEHFLDSLDDPALRSEEVERDLDLLLQDPGEGLEALRARLARLDRGTLRALIASVRRDWSEEDAEHMLARVEGARDRALQRLEDLQAEVERRATQARQAALHQADEIRKDAAVAAWWATGSAVASGAAAALGGIVAVLTPPLY